MSNLDLQLKLTAQDNASKTLKRALEDTTKSTQNLERATEQSAKSQEKANNSSLKASRTLKNEIERTAKTRTQAERDAQKSIKDTTDAYNTLKHAGEQAGNAQNQALVNARQGATGLSKELRNVNKEWKSQISTLDRVKNIYGNVSSLAAGLTGAAFALSAPMKNQMSYESQLAYMANKAFPERDVQGRKEGMKELDGVIRSSTQFGGNKESTLSAVNELLASGTVDMDSVKTLTPMLQKIATSEEADIVDIARIVISAKQAFGISDEDIPAALNMAISAGQDGRFELADMAKSLPNWLSLGKKLGMGGLEDFSTILTLGQTSMTTAGSADEAGTNVSNLLTKINSQDTATRLAKIKLNGKGIDLAGSLVHNREKGINTFDTFNGIVEQVLQQNPKYVALQKQLENAKNDDEKKATIEAMSQIFAASEIGKIIPDMQASQAYAGYVLNKSYGKEIKSNALKQIDLNEGERVGDLNYEFVSQTNAHKLNLAQNTRDFAQMDSVESLNNVLGLLSDNLVEYADKYPALTTALAGAEVGIKAFAAAAVGFGAMKLLNGGGKGGLGMPNIPGAGVLSSAGATPVYVTNWGDTNKSLSSIDTNTNNVAKGITGLSMVYQLMQNTEPAKKRLEELQADEKYAAENNISVGDAAAIREGRYDAPSERLWRWVRDDVFGDGDKNIVDELPKVSEPTINSIYSTTGSIPTYNPYLPAQVPAQQTQPQTVKNEIKLEVDGRVLAETVNEIMIQQANRGVAGGM